MQKYTWKFDTAASKVMPPNISVYIKSFLEEVSKNFKKMDKRNSRMK